MKWIWSMAIVTLAAASAAGAQSGTDMAKPMMGDNMKATYTGCIEDVNHGASLLLTHVSDAASGSMHGETAMKGDMAMKDGAMAPKDGAMANGKMDDMPSKTLTLKGLPTLKQHVGAMVSVTGSLMNPMPGSMASERPTLTVQSLKVLSKSCS